MQWKLEIAREQAKLSDSERDREFKVNELLKGGANVGRDGRCKGKRVGVMVTLIALS